MAAERARLHAEASALDGAIKTLELTWVRARQTIDRITDLRLAIFTRSLMERIEPAAAEFVGGRGARAPPLGRLLGYYLGRLVELGRSPMVVVLLLLLAGALVLYLGAKAVVRVTALGPREAGETRTFFERAAAASWIAPLRTLPAVMAALVVYGGLDSLGLLYYPSASIAAAAARARSLRRWRRSSPPCSPREPQRRLVSLSDRSARRRRYLQAMTFVYAADLALTSIGARSTCRCRSASSIARREPRLRRSAHRAVPDAVRALRHAARAAVARGRPRWLKVPLWAAALGIIVASALGYVALGRFAAQQLEMTGVVGLRDIALPRHPRLHARAERGAAPGRHHGWSGASGSMRRAVSSSPG